MELIEKKNEKQDELILQAFAADPKNGFRLMFDTYYAELCLYAVRITDSFYMSEDIVQEFFVLFWEKKYYKTIRQNLRYYLFYSVRNAILAALRKDNRVPLDMVLNDVDFADDIPSDDDKEVRLNEAFASMQKLSSQEREVIKHVFLENKKYKETAQELHISVNTVKTYLTRAMRHLRETCMPVWLAFLFTMKDFCRFL